MQSLYPLKMMPLFKNKIWGGNKIHSQFEIDYSPLPNCGEMWLLSGIEGNESIIENGFLEGNHINEILEIYMTELLGDKLYKKYGNEFPLLIKIIDAQDKLSIQVHPDDEFAEKKGLPNGKTEMWYILDADKNAEIINGFTKNTSKEEFLSSFNNHSTLSLLNRETVEKGDVFYIPGRRVHALCEGILLAEIQQSSDTTYRIYDWDRVDEQGKSRSLHLTEALDCIDYSQTSNSGTQYQYQLNKTCSLVNSPFFSCNLLHLNNSIKKDYSQLDSFIAYLCVEGKGTIRALGHSTPIQAGECILVPACAKEIEYEPDQNLKMLEIYIQE